ncbi:hypothetical protein LTR62_006935 [Meristemomyces frigidus]|uniref:BZIP domain-containing protein n=1 Tax=Meristemomyces frigidus TaxID=1508187 RepID=A0AAN7TBC2_9PEZI|nr:hypothetical protein LTR62_006935 [Meristemomyces frigidus]
MDSMDYSYFAPASSQPYSFIGYGQDHGFLPGLSNDGTITTPGLEDPLNANAFLGPFDYGSFDPTFPHSTGMTPITPEDVTQQTPHLGLLSNGSVDSGISMEMDHTQRSMSLEMDQEQHERRGSSEEEKDSMGNPAQSRRKAQNRAAQRAFRERKERHVRDLEAKLNLLTTTTISLQSDNERLKLMLQRAQTENEILRATAGTSPTSNHPPSFVDDPTLLPSSRPSKHRSLTAAGGEGGGGQVGKEPYFSTARLANGLLFNHLSSPRKLSDASSSRTDTQLLSASATWDLLQSHPLYLTGAVDIGEVCERLKRMAKCDDMGPMFEQEEVRRVIEEVGGSGGDGLL